MTIPQLVERWREEEKEMRTDSRRWHKNWEIVALAYKKHADELEHAVNAKKQKRHKGKLLCPCGFKGNAQNIREHRMNCPQWNQAIPATTKPNKQR